MEELAVKMLLWCSVEMFLCCYFKLEFVLKPSDILKAAELSYFW
jgi:hypothetical protein